MITVLGGGVGAAKFLKGLSGVIKDEVLKIIVNTGDDITISGLRISPDIDIIIYWLSNNVDRIKGWGIKGDTFNCLQHIRRFGLETWFNLGDKDLATQVYRNYLRQIGFKSSEITDKLAEYFGIKGAKILPMTDQDVETWIMTDDGEMHFQEYLIKRRMRPRVRGIKIKGIEKAKPAPGVIESILNSRIVILCPSNPIISIGPILKVGKIREALKRTKAQVLAISPIVGGRPLKGPADRLMKGLGLEVSSTQVAKLYRDFLDYMVIDNRDAPEEESIKSQGIIPIKMDTIMSNENKARSLAQKVLKINFK